MLPDPALEARARALWPRSCAASSARTSRSTIPTPTSPTICAGWCASGWSPATATRRCWPSSPQRYGDFVLLKPPVEPATWLLWFGPALLLAIGAAGVAIHLRRRRAEPEALSAAEQARLEALLGPQAPDRP